MLFKNIGLVTEDFSYREGMYVGIIEDRIAYIGETAPSEDSGSAPEEELFKITVSSNPRKSGESSGCCGHVYKSGETHPLYGEVYDGTGKVLMPAFYNAHGHSPMCLMRGYGENLPLDRWLNEKIFPFEDKLYSEAVYWSTLLTMAESIRYGIVSTSDMYYFIDDMVRAISVSGMKSNISRAVAGIGCERLEDCIGYREMSETIMMYDGFANGKIIVEASAHAEYTNSEYFLRAIAETAKEFDVRMHVHVAETESETKGCIERYGRTPVAFLADCGLFDVPANAAHCVWLTDEDRDILAEKKVSVSSNTVSNMKLASGICDVPALYAKGINVAIGTDSVASNNSLNFFEEMKLFALCGKFRAMDPSVMTPEQVLHSATRSGAIAQGRMDAGLIKEGFKADLIVVDASVPNMKPSHDILNALIYSADGKDICLTMCDGKVLYRDGIYMTMDVERAMAEAENATKKILSLM